jgi:hypothetical protein
VDGSGFHLYAGEMSALSEVHDAFPEKAPSPRSLAPRVNYQKDRSYQD